eukprot:7700906-Heterocapsa_arctica.AAC.1
MDRSTTPRSETFRPSHPGNVVKHSGSQTRLSSTNGLSLLARLWPSAGRPPRPRSGGHPQEA